MKRKAINLFIATSFIFALLFLVGCGTSQTNDDNNDSGTEREVTDERQDASFVYAITGDPMSTNPIVVTDRFGLTVVNMIYSPLARLDHNNDLKYELATSMVVSEDGLTMTVHLRDDVLWSDGEPFTAEDVVFTYETRAAKENGNYLGMWINDEVIEVEAVDEFTVLFHLPTVSAAAVNNLLFEVYIMPKHVFENEADFSVSHLVADPVGTGPYRLVYYSRGQYLQFEANETYFRGIPNIQNVTLQIIENVDTQRMALQSGEIDAAIIFPADIESLDPDLITIFPYSENRVGYMGMNVLTEELSDVRVRQAIRYALNTHDMNLAVYMSEAFFNSPVSILPPNNPFATTDVNTYETNLERARELLAEAGVENLEINMAFDTNDPPAALQATLAREQLAQIGITVNLQGGDGAAISAELRRADSTRYHMFVRGYIMGNDPDGYRPLFHSTGGSNFFNYSSEIVDRLFDEAAVEMDEAVRRQLYVELQQQIAEDAFFVPIVDNLRILAVNNRIGGVEDAGLIPIYTFEDMSQLFIQ